MPAVCPIEVSPLAHSISNVWMRGGWVGVDLFFVLSGFLVSGLLFREYQSFGYISAKRFLIRRGLKIYPAFWMLIISTGMYAVANHAPIHPKATLSELLFLQNYWAALWNHTWSLAVEEHFYLALLGVVVFFSAKSARADSFKPIPLLFLTIAGSCLTLRLVTHIAYPTFGRIHLASSHLRFDSLFFGVLISYISSFHAERFESWTSRRRIPLILCGALLIVPPFIYPLDQTPWMFTFGYTLFYIGSGLLLIGCLTLPMKGRVWRFVGRIGVYSYSIYLWHMPIRMWLIPRLEEFLGHERQLTVLSVYLAGSILGGILMAWFIEMPILRARNRWFPSRSDALPVAGELKNAEV